MIKEIKKSELINLIKYLSSSYDIYLPQKKGSGWAYQQFSSDTEIISLRPHLTILPPKKYFFPINQKIFSLNKDMLSYSQKNKRGIIILGVNSFDIQAQVFMDQIMSKPIKDPYYLENREKIILIGSGPERINIANNGYDIFLEENNNFFLALSETPRGKEILKSKYFTTTKHEPKKILSFKDPVLSDLVKIQKAIESSYGGKIWKDLADTCFGCGICSYVCPMCYCYEHEDNFVNNKCDSCRTKRWDACFLPDFFATAGLNSREKLSDRIYNWYHHKFVRMPKEYGFVGCVDCGRCIEFCPAKINFKKLLISLTK